MLDVNNNVNHLVLDRLCLSPLPLDAPPSRSTLAVSPAPSYVSHRSSNCGKITFTSLTKKQLQKTHNVQHLVGILQTPSNKRTKESIDELVNFFENFQILSPELDALVAQDTFRMFVAMSQHKHVAHNEYVFRKGERGNEFYFVLRGEAAIYEVNDKFSLDFGNMFGEPAVFDAETKGKRYTDCRTISKHGVDLAVWNKRAYDVHIAPILQLPMHKYKQQIPTANYQQQPQTAQECFSVSDNASMKSPVDSKQSSSNDSEALHLWRACCDPEDDSFAYFSILYPLLVEIFAEKTKYTQLPLRADLEWILVHCGAKKTKLSNIHFPETRNYQMIISYDSFMRFFRWFQATFDVVRDLQFLDRLEVDLFCSIVSCESLLKKEPLATFMLTLSGLPGAIRLSYRRDNQYSKKHKNVKHIDILRIGQDKWMIAKNKKRGLTKLSSIIRSFVKIKYLYTPQCLCTKKSIF